MGVAAKLGLDATVRRAREVVGHDDGRSPQKRERGGHHARVPDRHEFLEPAFGLRLKEIDRVGPIGRGRPPCVAARGRPARGAPTFVASLVACVGRPVVRRALSTGEKFVSCSISLIPPS